MPNKALQNSSVRPYLSFLTLIAVLLLIAGASAVSAKERPVVVAEGDEIPFDTDRGIWVFDTDGDTWPDLTEELDGTDPNDAAEYPGSSIPAGVLGQKELDFPSSPCRGSFTQQKLRLCISAVKDSATYRTASATCSVIGARVCDFEDLYYIYQQTANDANFNPNGKWLGHFTGDSTVHCGNRSVTFNNDPDIANFDGTCSASGSRTYWCCHTKS